MKDGTSMKFKALVFVRLRSQVDDSPGNAVRDACKRLSELDIKKLRLGKVVDVWLEAESREYAEKELEMLSDRFLANTVMEDWDYELTEIENFPKGIEA
jgi:phosphoribosylformylglycinamidine synthase